MAKFIFRLIITALLLLLLLAGLAWFAPASLLGYWLEKQQAPLQLGLLEGQLRSGSARQARWSGLDLGKLEWQLKNYTFNPPSTQVNIQVTGPQMHAQGTLRVADEHISSNKLSGYFPAGWLDLQGVAPFVYASGKIQFTFSELDINGNKNPSATGLMDWKNAGLNGLLDVSLGNIHFDINTAENNEQASNPVNSSRKVIVHFNTEGNTELQLNGTIKTDGKSYQLDCLARATTGRNDITRFLQKAGKAEAGGAYRIQFTGLLSPGN